MIGLQLKIIPRREAFRSSWNLARPAFTAVPNFLANSSLCRYSYRYLSLMSPHWMSSKTICCSVEIDSVPTYTGQLKSTHGPLSFGYNSIHLTARKSL